MKYKREALMTTLSDADNVQISSPHKPQPAAFVTCSFATHA